METERRTSVYQSDVAFTSARIQAAAIYCSDGRFGDQIDEFLHHALVLPRYDRLALPGGAACLGPWHFRGYRQQEALVESLRFLVAVHQLQRVVLIAHSDCAYYTEWLHVDREGLEVRQSQDLTAAADRIRRLDGGLIIQGFLARRCEERVRFEEIPVG